jgi:hypothetical protein
MSNCAEDSVIKWDHVHALAKTIDKVAEDLDITGYTNLVPDLRPLQYEELPGANTSLVFELDGYSDTVLKAYIAKKLTGQLVEMADANALAFLADADGCLCRAVYAVISVSAGHHLRQVVDADRKAGCCQSLFIPQEGDHLNYTQNVIPAGYIRYYLDKYANFKPDKSNTEYGPACTAGGPTITYTITAGKGLTKVSRPMTGKFTWPIESRVFQAMWDALEDILSKSCGAKADAFYIDGDTSNRIPVNCSVTMGDVIWTIKQEGSSTGDEKGGFKTETDRPWYTPTNSGEKCEDNGPKVYCNTFRHMEEIANKMASGLAEKENGKCNCPECDGHYEFYFNHGCDCAEFDHTLNYVDKGGFNLDTSTQGNPARDGWFSISTEDWKSGEGCKIKLNFTCAESDPDCWGKGTPCHEGAGIEFTIGVKEPFDYGTVSTSSETVLDAYEICCAKPDAPAPGS